LRTAIRLRRATGRAGIRTGRRSTGVAGKTKPKRSQIGAEFWWLTGRLASQTAGFYRELWSLAGFEAPDAATGKLQNEATVDAMGGSGWEGIATPRNQGKSNQIQPGKSRTRRILLDHHPVAGMRVMRFQWTFST